MQGTVTLSTLYRLPRRPFDPYSPQTLHRPGYFDHPGMDGRQDVRVLGDVGSTQAGPSQECAGRQSPGSPSSPSVGWGSGVNDYGRNSSEHDVPYLAPTCQTPTPVSEDGRRGHCCRGRGRSCPGSTSLPLYRTHQRVLSTPSPWEKGLLHCNLDSGPLFHPFVTCFSFLPSKSVSGPPPFEDGASLGTHREVFSRPRD